MLSQHISYPTIYKMMLSKENGTLGHVFFNPQQLRKVDNGMCTFGWELASNSVMVGSGNTLTLRDRKKPKHQGRKHQKKYHLASLSPITQFQVTDSGKRGVAVTKCGP